MDESSTMSTRMDPGWVGELAGEGCAEGAAPFDPSLSRLWPDTVVVVGGMGQGLEMVSHRPAHRVGCARRLVVSGRQAARRGLTFVTSSRRLR
jgi:hypothetical protein